MEYVKHHAIVVTSWDKDKAYEARHAAQVMRLEASTMCVSKVNGYHSFMILPDGSKENCDDSSEGDKRRTKFKSWLAQQRDEAGDSRYEWVEVAYSADDRAANVTDSEWAKVEQREPEKVPESEMKAKPVVMPEGGGGHGAYTALDPAIPVEAQIKSNAAGHQMLLERIQERLGLALDRPDEEEVAYQLAKIYSLTVNAKP
ncbi:MAG: hypothetical protein ACRC62_34005 [Microcoleus sp.]